MTRDNYCSDAENFERIDFSERMLVPFPRWLSPSDFDAQNKLIELAKVHDRLVYDKTWKFDTEIHCCCGALNYRELKSVVRVVFPSAKLQQRADVSLQFHTLEPATVAAIDELCFAICAGDAELFKAKLTAADACADFHVSAPSWMHFRSDTTRRFITLLHGACSVYRSRAKSKVTRAAGVLDIIRVLLAAGADPNVRCEVPAYSQFGAMPPLFIAPSAAIARMLIEASADVNAVVTNKRDDGEEYSWTALGVATEKGYDDVVNVLLDNGAEE